MLRCIHDSHLECKVILENIFQKVLGVRMVSIIQLLEVFQRRMKLLQPNLSNSTADRCRLTRKPD